LKLAEVRNVDFKKEAGLVPVIAQERGSGRVLMLAYANALALERTLQTGFAHYWSRSRQKLWKKGEESGHLQRVHEILVDCDGDALVYSVEQTGPACHTGEMTCFFRGIEVKPTSE
jgi:phosphoribosyl-AMP cyclohydrolase